MQLKLEHFNDKVQKKSYDEKGCTPAQTATGFSNGKSQYLGIPTTLIVGCQVFDYLQ